ncbi:MAG: amidohydrolase [Sphingobacteriaceae bacterium]|nr:amidohydrolase [Sphingobacteriaceae bacterium]
MNVTIIQTHLHWEDVEMNIQHFGKLISSIPTKTDLIILPEMFTTGFTRKPEKNAEDHLGIGFEGMQNMAQEKNAVITGSISTKEDNNYYNRLFWVEPNGKFDSYDKRHLFRMAKEDEFYTAGKKKIIKKINDWKICPLICYDLRFPVWSRNKFKNGQWDYDVLIYVANWPEVRNQPWKQLLIARAIENQCYVIGVNRIGKDGNDFAHSGDSMVVNPRGEIISHTKANEESMETITLDMDYLEDFRKVFPVGLDSDEFSLDI